VYATIAAAAAVRKRRKYHDCVIFSSFAKSSWEKSSFRGEYRHHYLYKAAVHTRRHDDRILYHAIFIFIFRFVFRPSLRPCAVRERLYTQRNILFTIHGEHNNNITIVQLLYIFVPTYTVTRVSSPVVPHRADVFYITYYYYYNIIYSYARRT